MDKYKHRGCTAACLHADVEGCQQSEEASPKNGTSILVQSQG